jgi:3-dehydroquinate synthase
MLPKLVDAPLEPNWLHHHFRVRYTVPVVFTSAAFAPAILVLRRMPGLRERQRRHRVLVCIDAGVAAALPRLDECIAAYASAHADATELAGAGVILTGGAACKNAPAQRERLLGGQSKRPIDRHAYLLAIGGGALPDLAGFAAAVLHRGVRHIRFRTTVPAQCDSGGGVKYAVNWHGQKNLVGTFSPAWGVVNDDSFITAMPDREKRPCMAEAVKVALIRDGAFFLRIERQARQLAAFEPVALSALIAHSARLHMAQIAHGGAPFERARPAPLDCGHWAAQTLERLSPHGLSHGEAVAIGRALDARYAVLAGLLAAGADERIHRLSDNSVLRGQAPVIGAPAIDSDVIL